MKPLQHPFAAGLVIVLATATLLNADPLDQWQWRNPLPQGNSIHGLTYGSGMFIAVGDLGVILTSPDGMTWTSRHSGVAWSLTGITHQNGLFVAVGDNGILSSTNGTTWTFRLGSGLGSLKSVAARPGLFVAVGGAGGGTRGTTWSSPDAVTWTPHDTPALSLGVRGLLFSVTYGNGLFVAVGEYDLFTSRGESIVTSTDGETWTVRRDGPYLGSLRGVTYGNGRFIAVGDSGFYSSANGITWALSATFTNRSYMSVTYQGGRFVAVGGEDGGALLRPIGAMAVSVNGQIWSNQTTLASFVLNGSATGNGVDVAGGDYGVMLTSTNAQGWANRAPWVSVRTLQRVASGGGTLVAVGEYGAILSSTDGAQWTARTPGNDYDHSLNGVAYGGERFVAAGNFGLVRTSTDTLNWTSQTVTNTHFNGVAYGNGRFVLVEQFGGIRYSTNGVDWIAGHTTNAPVFKSVTYGGDRFVAVGSIVNGDTYLGISSTSTDGQYWENRYVSQTSLLWDVTYGNGQFVALGDEGVLSPQAAVAISSDGRTWTRALPNVAQEWHGVAYGGGMFVAVSYGQFRYPNLGSPILTSPDGVTWTARNAGDYFRLHGVAFHNGAFVAVGTDGAILQSGVTLLNLSGGMASGSGAIELIMQGGVERPYRLQAAAELPSTNWTDLLTFTNTAPTTNFVDTSATNFNRRFYRVVSP